MEINEQVFQKLSKAALAALEEADATGRICTVTLSYDAETGEVKTQVTKGTNYKAPAGSLNHWISVEVNPAPCLHGHPPNQAVADRLARNLLIDVADRQHIAP